MVLIVMQSDHSCGKVSSVSFKINERSIPQLVIKLSLQSIFVCPLIIVLAVDNAIIDSAVS